MDFFKGIGIGNADDKNRETPSVNSNPSSINTDGPFAVLDDSKTDTTEGHTDGDQTTTADPSSQPKENCVILNKTKGPLKEDVEFINGNDFKGLIAKSFGKSSKDSEGRYGWAKAAAKTAYYDKQGNYDICTPNRKEKEQTFIDETGEKPLKAGEIKYGMNLLDTEEKTQELPNLLNLFFSETNETLTPLLKEFGKYLEKEEKDINFEYNEIMELEDNGVKVFDVEALNNEDDEATKAHKMLFCFAWEHSGGKAASEGIMKGGMFSDPESDPESDPDGENKKKENPSTALVVPSQSRGKYKKYIMYTMCIMGFIYFSFVLFEAFRLFIGTANRILDARATYLYEHPELAELDGDNGGADHNYLNYFYSFFTIMYQSGAGTLIGILDQYQEAAKIKVQSILSVVATETGRAGVERCQQGWFSCINGYFTGATTSESFGAAKIVADTQLNTAYINSIQEIKLSFNKIISDANFATTGIITGINGLVTCTVVMGNLVYPATYRIEHVTASVASLQSSYLTSPIWGLTAIGTNVSILFAPKAIENIQREGETSSNEISIPDEVDGGKKNPRFFNLLMGGKRKTGKRKLRRKTVKKKKKKQQRKTKRRKTIKKKNKRKTKRKN